MLRRWQNMGLPSPGPCCSFPRSLCLPCPVRRAASPADLMSPVLAQEQAGLLPWGTVASAMGSSPRGVSAAFLAGPLGRAQTDPPQGNEFSSGTSSICWGWPSTRTQLCLRLSARTATPSSTSATASSSPSCRESTSPRQATGRPARSRRSSFVHLVGVQGPSSLHAGECRGRGPLQWGDASCPEEQACGCEGAGQTCLGEAKAPKG